MKNRLILTALLFLLVMILVGVMVYLGYLNSTLALSLAMASAVGLANFIFFVLFMRFSLKKSNKIFLVMNFGGMIFRLILMLFVVFLVLFYLKVDRYAFIFGLLFWYLFFQVFEILIVKESYKKS